MVELPGAGVFEVNVGKSSFWKTCRELIHKDIGRWLLDCGLAPWRRGSPPQVTVEIVRPRQFRILTD